MKKRLTICVTVLLIVVVALFTLVGCAGNKSTEYDVVKTTKMNNYELLNQTAKHNQVVFIGDSIVELFPTYEMFADKDLIVYNRGISGDTSDRLLERLEKNALNIAPKTMFILVGTNDISRKIEHETILSNITKTIEKAKEKGAQKVIVSGLFPVNKSINSAMVGSRTNKEITEFNAKLKTAAEGKSAVFADLTSVLADKDGNFNKDYTYDGLHPNAKGYQVITNAILPLIFE